MGIVAKYICYKYKFVLRNLIYDLFLEYNKSENNFLVFAFYSIIRTYFL